MFDAALIESAVRHGDGRTARSLPLAVGFHAAVLGALVLSALASTGEPPESVIPIGFPSFESNPPPPPSGGAAPIRAVLPRARTDAPPVRNPEEIPADSRLDREMPTDTAAEDAAGNSEGSESGGQRDGIEGGVPFGTGTSDVAGLPDGRAGTDALHRPGVGGVTVPELLERVDPVYPEAARKARIQGVVLLEAVITASGAVDQVRIVGSAGPILDAAASSAVRRWRYRPATLHEHPVAVLLTVTVRFGLNG